MNSFDQSPNQVLRSGFHRVVPTALTILPIGILFGVLASRADWSVSEVLLLSMLGFSGSGQFALLPLAEQGVGFFTMWAMAVSINSRYIPMAFISASRLPNERPQRAFLAHLLGDEAYALELESDPWRRVAAIRATIYVTWVLSHVFGVLIASLIPKEFVSTDIQLGFPASLVLMLLSLEQLKSRVPQIGAPLIRIAAEIFLCVSIALSLFLWLGPLWFWLPSLGFSCWRLWRTSA